MTYTIVARCMRTGAVGVGITTFGLAVTGKCAALRTGIGVISTQAMINPTFKAFGLRLLEQGYTAQQVVARLAESDPNIGFRQVAVVDRWGGADCVTGAGTRPYNGHKIGHGYVALGNTLTSDSVIGAMSAAFEESDGEPLAERLLRALEGGRNCGGQTGADGQLPERSAGVIVHEMDEDAALDLRVDRSSDAVTELRSLHDEYLPHVAYHRSRWLDPASTLPQEKFIALISQGRRAE